MIPQMIWLNVLGSVLRQLMCALVS
jgi:hypothetical protein